jgi:hypothetical protein
MFISTVRSTRLVQLPVALGAAAAISGGVAAVAADDAEAARCDVRSQSEFACGEDTPPGPQP